MRHSQKYRSQLGFTLIELLFAIAIVALLTAIAIPQFAEYRARSFDARARSDLTNVARAEEAYFVSNETYLSCDEVSCPNVLPGIHDVSTGVTLEVTATTSGFSGTSTHPLGLRTICRWESNGGGNLGCH